MFRLGLQIFQGLKPQELVKSLKHAQNYACICSYQNWTKNSVPGRNFQTTCDLYNSCGVCLDDPFIIEKATMDDKNRILELLRSTFFVDEPLLQSAGLSGNVPSLFEEYILNTIWEGTSLLALIDNKLVGVAINGTAIPTCIAEPPPTCTKKPVETGKPTTNGVDNVVSVDTEIAANPTNAEPPSEGRPPRRSQHTLLPKNVQNVQPIKNEEIEKAVNDDIIGATKPIGTEPKDKNIPLESVKHTKNVCKVDVPASPKELDTSASKQTLDPTEIYTKGVEKLFTLYSHIDESANLWQTYAVDKVWDIRILATDKKYRRQGIASALCERSITMARNLKYRIVRMDCTNLHVARLAESLKLPCVYMLPYIEYMDETKKPIFDPDVPHTFVKVYAQQI